MVRAGIKGDRDPGYGSTSIDNGILLCWRCHRLLISNTLVARGWEVVHLRVGSAPAVHELGAWGPRPVVREDGTVIRRVDDVAPGDALQARLSDGNLRVRVESSDS